MPKKKEAKTKSVETESVPTEQEELEERQAYLLGLRDQLLSERVSDIGQLENLLGVVNQRLEVLNNA